jgi:hypothetical protein
MNRLIATVCLALFLPFSSAFAKSVTIGVLDELNFESIRTYNDGMTFITKPQMYGYFLGTETIGESEVNATFVCNAVGMKYFDEAAFLFNEGEQRRTVTYSNTESQSPRFVKRAMGLKTVICKR